MSINRPSFFLGSALAVLALPSLSLADVIGGNDVIPRPAVDGATSIIFFDLNSPISTNGAITSWSIFASSQQSGEGKLKLKIFRDIGATWQFVGESPLETVATWGAVNTFLLPVSMPVQAGDIVAWWYPGGTVPSVTYSGSGQTMNNGDWGSNPDVDITYDVPDLLANRSWGGHGWDVNSRMYSIQVLPEPATLGLLALGGLALIRRRR